MNRREWKKARKARRLAVAEQIRQQRSRLDEARRRGATQRPKKPTKRRLLLLALLLLLLLLRECSCEAPEPAPPPPPPPRAEEEVTEPEPVVRPPPQKPPIRKRTAKRDRPAYEGTASRKATWIDAFRLEVSGRSVRLSACFEGVERPGAVKWGAAIDPATGKVSDQSLEPTASTVDLTERQQTCLEQVLSNPPYRLATERISATPKRVSLVLEF